MYLLIDWGNTLLKYLVVAELDNVINGTSSIEVGCVATIEELMVNLGPIEKSRKFNNILIASVRADAETNELKESFERLGLKVFIARTASRNCGVICAYSKPSKLGIDRWLAILAAYDENRCVAIIDIGSAITLDIVSSDGQHCGGHILPGRRLLRNSLLNTARVKAEHTVNKEIEFKVGHSTGECVDYGVEQMIAGYLTNAIESSFSKYKVTHCIFTGGDASLWMNWLSLNERIPCELSLQYDPIMVFRGLAKLFYEVTAIAHD